ncbi:MAG: hypothetical protein K6C40_03810 [Thermoguttaceae bacterium]|nr:hypothetical protein [Thermoguttaceae bacterium]
MKHSFLLFSLVFLLLLAFPASGRAQDTNLEFFPTELTDPVSANDAPENVEFLGGGAFKENPAGDETADETGNETGEESPEPEDEDFVELNSIQDFWNLYDVSASFRERYTDEAPWSYEEGLLFFFYHLQEHITQERLEEWAKTESELADLDAIHGPELNPKRFDAFWIYGRLLSFEKTKLEEAIKFRFGVPSFYTCKLELNDGRHVTLFCQQIPRALQKPGALASKPRVGLIALFLKKGEKEENVSIPDPKNPGEKKELASMFMLGRRLAWYPDTLLGNAGFDEGLFDDLDREELPEDAKRSAMVDMRLTMRNRECFYQMMNTVFHMPPDSLAKIVADVEANAPDEHFEKINYPGHEKLLKEGKRPKRYSSVVPLFNQPAKERGHFFFLKGVARRILPIRVDDSDVNNRFGIDHYYEIFIFPDETPESPIAVLVPELPLGVKPGNDMGYYVELEIPAFFFNTWSYEKGKTPDGKPLRRLTPLLIGGIPAQTVSTVYTPDLTWFLVIGGTVFTALFIFSTILFFVSSRENEIAQRNRMKMYSLPEGTRFENEVQDAPEEKEMGFEEWVQKNQ